MAPAKTDSNEVEYRPLWIVSPIVGGFIVGPVVYSIVKFPLIALILIPPFFGYFALTVPCFIAASIFGGVFHVLTSVFPSLRSNTSGAALLIAAAVIGAAAGHLTLVFFAARDSASDMSAALSGSISGVIVVYWWMITTRNKLKTTEPLVPASNLAPTLKEGHAALSQTAS